MQIGESKPCCTLRCHPTFVSRAAHPDCVKGLGIDGINANYVSVQILHMNTFMTKLPRAWKPSVGEQHPGLTVITMFSVSACRHFLAEASKGELF